MGISPTLNIPQARFLAMQHKFKAYVAGFGSGKTWVGCGGICKGMWEHPKINQGYFAPTYPQIRDIFYLEWLERQPVQRQDQVLGAERGRLFRAGEIDLADMFTDKGEWISLERLKQLSGTDN